ncbi:MAG: BREX-2 system adenine-specific DNA-methyltransferase PglX, partial [Planctomycetota bacterium]|nr:BREX-2 system adenine-specific DNA-methyltransferase PglX [Planctomycetota bacterium]
EAVRGQMIALQEGLDWQCYRLYGLTKEELTQRRKGAKEEENQENLCALAPLREPPALLLGQRAFEIVMARKMATGDLQTTWFARHGSTPMTEIPGEWPEDYRRLVEQRIEAIESNPQIALIEQPEYKRRWNTESWASQLERALREWLLARLESYFDFDGRMSVVSSPLSVAGTSVVSSPLSVADDHGPRTSPPPLATVQLVSLSTLTDVAARDTDFMQVAELYRDRQDFDVGRLVAELVEAESVPLLPVLRYKSSGLDKRQAWERTWELQRQEDRRMSVVSCPWSVAEGHGPRTTDHGQLTTDIPVPPKYTSADFLSGPCWRLRGKLDVPKERWVSFPHCEGEDGTLMIAWAGLDHLQLARAVSGYLVEVQEKYGATDPRLVPLLGGIIELVPWLKQWHNEPDSEFDNMRMGDYFASFVEQEARTLGLTVAAVRAWQPLKKGARKGAKTKVGK